jgi:hypothetical protein
MFAHRFSYLCLGILLLSTSLPDSPGICHWRMRNLFRYWKLIPIYSETACLFILRPLVLGYILSCVTPCFSDSTCVPAVSFCFIVARLLRAMRDKMSMPLLTALHTFQVSSLLAHLRLAMGYGIMVPIRVLISVLRLMSLPLGWVLLVLHMTITQATLRAMAHLRYVAL